MGFDLLALYRAVYPGHAEMPTEEEFLDTVAIYDEIAMNLVDGLSEAEILKNHVAIVNQWCLENGVGLESREHETRIAMTQRFLSAAVALARGAEQ
jgi:hypothetical protein